MTAVQSVSTKNEYKRHYIKSTGVIASAALGATYGLTRGGLTNDRLGKVLYPLDYNLETFLSKKPIGKKFVDFMKKSNAVESFKKAMEEHGKNFSKEAVYDSAEIIETVAKKRGSIPGMINLPKNYKLDKSLAAKGSILLVGTYILAKVIKKGLDYLLYDRYRK